MNKIISLFIVLILTISLVSAGELGVKPRSVAVQKPVEVPTEVESSEEKSGDVYEDKEETPTTETRERNFLRNPTFEDLTVKGKLLVDGSALISDIYAKDLSLRTKGNLVVFSDAVVLKDTSENSKLTIQKDSETEKKWLIQSSWLKLLGHDGLELESGSGSVTVKSLLKLANGLNVDSGESVFEGPVITQSTLDAWNGFSVSKGLSTFVDKVTILGPLSVMNDAKIAHLYTRSIESDVAKFKSLWVDETVTFENGANIRGNMDIEGNVFFQDDGAVVFQALRNEGTVGYACLSGQGEIFRSEKPCEEWN